MGNVHQPLPVKLFIGMLSPEPALFDACAHILKKAYGPLESESAVLPWDKTDYYRDEMGPSLLRKFLFFAQVIDPGELPLIKNYTNTLEKQYVVSDGVHALRRINLDPGYVTEAKVVLATTKDFAHRVYIGNGMYAEVTLRFDAKKRSFEPQEHTYPDYRTREYLELFNEVRKKLRTSLTEG